MSMPDTVYFTILEGETKDDLREGDQVLFSIVLRLFHLFVIYFSRYNVKRNCTISCFVRRERGKKEKRRGFPIYFSFAGSRETREKSYEIDVRFIRTVESHLSISMAVLVVRSKFNPARKSRILIGGYNFAADRRCFSHPSSSVSPFEN